MSQQRSHITLAGKTTSSVERPLLVSHKDAAQLVGVGLSTWMRYVAAEKTPEPIHLSGKLVRFRTADLESWVAAGCPPRDEWLNQFGGK